jgi:hypothetical protein
MDFLYEHHEVGESFPVDVENKGGDFFCECVMSLCTLAWILGRIGGIIS